MGKPLVIIVNGLPGTGKTTLAKRLAADVQLPVLIEMAFTKHSMMRFLSNERTPSLTLDLQLFMLYFVTGSLLAAGQQLIVECSFGLSE